MGLHDPRLPAQPPPRAFPAALARVAPALALTCRPASPGPLRRRGAAFSRWAAAFGGRPPSSRAAPCWASRGRSESRAGPSRAPPAPTARRRAAASARGSPRRRLAGVVLLASGTLNVTGAGAQRACYRAGPRLLPGSGPPARRAAGLVHRARLRGRVRAAAGGRGPARRRRPRRRRRPAPPCPCRPPGPGPDSAPTRQRGPSRRAAALTRLRPVGPPRPGTRCGCGEARWTPAGPARAAAWADRS